MKYQNQEERAVCKTQRNFYFNKRIRIPSCVKHLYLHIDAMWKRLTKSQSHAEYTEEKLQFDHVTRLFIQRLDSFLNRDLIRNAFCRLAIWQIPIVVSLTWPFYFSAFFCGTPLLNVPLQFIQWLQRKSPHSERDKWNLFKNCGCLSSGLKFERCECPVRRWI